MNASSSAYALRNVSSGVPPATVAYIGLLKVRMFWITYSILAARFFFAQILVLINLDLLIDS